MVLVPVDGGESRWVDTPDSHATPALAGPATGAVTRVTGASGVEQPVSVD